MGDYGELDQIEEELRNFNVECMEIWPRDVDGQMDVDDVEDRQPGSAIG